MKPLVVAESEIDGAPGVVNLSLTKTLSVLDYRETYSFSSSDSSIIKARNQFDSITDASVDLYENGLYFAKLTSSGSAHYTNAKTLVEGNRYEVRVNAPGEDEMRAAFTYPYSANVAVESNIKETKEGGGELVTLKLRFTDREPGVRNYFRFRVDQHIKTIYTFPYTPQTVEYDQDVLFTSKSILLSRNFAEETNVDPEGDDEGQQFNDFAYFNDELFDGGSTLIEIKFYFAEGGTSTGITSTVDNQVKIEAVPTEMALFMKSLITQYFNDGDPFAQPTELYTNFNKGIGVFAIPSLKIVKVD